MLTALPAGFPNIAIVQRALAVFPKTFANRLKTEGNVEVRDAVDGDSFTPSLALITPDNLHIPLQRSVDHNSVRIGDGPQGSLQCPTLDLLFKSAGNCSAAHHTIAGALTDMRNDGDQGLPHLRDKGATTVAQDNAT